MSETGGPGGGRRRRVDAAEPPERSGDSYDFVEDGDSGDVLGWMAFAESRTDRRTERRRRFRNRLVALGVVVVLAVAGVGGWLLYGALADATPPPDARNTILFQVSGPTGDAIGSALLVVDPARGTAVALAVPNGLDVDVTGASIITFGQALGQLGTGGCRDALGELLGVKIGGSWTLTAVSFASLIDQAGGVQVDVDTSFPGLTATVKPGTQILDGADATLYAALAVPGQPAAAQTSRFTQVLDSLLHRLVPGKASMASILAQIGMVPDASLPQDTLAGDLAQLVSTTQAGHLTTGSLPVVPVPDASPHQSLDVTAASPLVKQLLGGTVRTVRADGPPRVLVEDGTDGALAPGGPTPSKSSKKAAATAAASPSAGPSAAVTSWPSLSEEAQVALTGAGFVAVSGGSLPDGRTAAHTQILISDPGKRAVADQVAQVLGYSDSVVKVTSTTQLTDVVVIVGKDYDGTP